MVDATADDSAQAREAKVAAVQAAVDRVTSWQDGATVETVRAELRRALDEAGVDVTDEFVDQVATHVHHAGEHIDVKPLLR